MTELRDLLQRAAPPAPAFDDHALMNGVTRRSRRQRAAWFGGIAVAVVAVAVAVTAVVHRDSGRPAVTVSPSSVAETTTTFTLPRAGYQSIADVPKLPASAVQTVRLPALLNFNGAPAPDGDNVWVAGCQSHESGCTGLSRVDLATGESHEVPVSDLTPPDDTITQVAVGAGGVFILTNGFVGAPFHITRLDPVDGHAQWTVAVPGTSVSGDPKARLAFGVDALWFSEGTHPVVELSPTDGSIVATIPIVGYVENNGQVGFAFDRSFAYVVGGPNGTAVFRIDPTTKTARVAHDFSPGFSQSLAADGQYVWTTHYTQRGRLELVRVDTAQGDHADAVGVPTYEVAAGDGQTWFLGWNPVSTTRSPSNDYGLVGRIDPKTGQVVTRVSIDVDALDTTWLIVHGGKAYVLDATKRTFTTITP